MTAAFNTLLTLLVVWGLPVYLIDRRARFNDRPGWMRFAIAFFMLFYFLIVPVFVAFALAGPKRPRRSRRETGFLAASTRYAETQRRPEPEPPVYDGYQAAQDEDDRAARANEKRYQAHQLVLAKRRREAEEWEKQALEALPVQVRAREPSRHSQTRPYRTPQQRTAEREQQALQARRERQEQAARDKQQRQERADRERQAQNDLFMTWDERGEEELPE